MLDAVFVKRKNGLIDPTSLSTRWTAKVQNEEITSLYPRPSMVRNSFFCLNGMWDYAITKDELIPSRFDGKIRVPFSPEAPLSQVNRQLQPGEYLWYSKSFLLPQIEEGYHYKLNFGAVDQECTVFINEEECGSHIGGYLPFSIDLDKAKTDTEFNVTVRVKDDSDESYHARGKQKLRRGGMFYTAQSGIWQTVWIEKVYDTYIKEVKIKPDLEKSGINVKISLQGKEEEVNSFVRIDTYKDVLSRDNSDISINAVSPLLALDDAENIAVNPAFDFIGNAKGNDIFIKIDNPHLWSGEDPFLYNLIVTTPHDEVHCYFGMRSIKVDIGEGGLPCFYLNGKPYFQSGLLDQGYWPDGLYTASCDEALVYDIQTAKSLGFNLLRKHIKIEPERWYYHCDRLGMLVWQDMVCGGGKLKQWFVTYLATLMNATHISVKDKSASRFLLSRTNKEGRKEFKKEVFETIDTLYNHPSIIMWVPFNEGWGQFDAADICRDIKSYDSTRLVDHASGWFDQHEGDISSIHYYFFKLKFKPDPKRILALSEYGGYAWQVENHSFSRDLYGYKGFKCKEDLTDGYKELMEQIIIPARQNGIFAFVYTQISDIEDEVNGIMTYDREIIKIDEDVLRECNRALTREYP